MNTLKPNFFIVGTAKAGTTSLYHYLSQHDEIFCPNVKEPNYYSNIIENKASVYDKPKKRDFYHRKVINDYKSYLNLYSNASNAKILIDSSPSYLWDNQAAQKIYNDNPDAKILIILRNPVMRAFSHYLMDVRNGDQKEMSFIQAVINDCDLKPYSWGHAHLYVGLGLYHDQVKRYLDLFGKENVKILIYEDFFKNLESGLKDLFNFINVNSDRNINFNKAHNTFFMPKNKFYLKLLQYKSSFKLYGSHFPDCIKKRVKKRMFDDSNKPKLSQEEYDEVLKYFKEDILKTENLLTNEIQLKANLKFLKFKDSI